MGDDDPTSATPKRKSKKFAEGRGVPVFAPLPPLHSRERETKNSFTMEEGLPLVREKRDRERKEREERRDDRKDERSSAGKNASTENSDKNKASGSSQDDDGKKKRTRVKTPVCTARNKVPRLSESESQPTPSVSTSTSTVSSSNTSTLAQPPPPQPPPPPPHPQRPVDPEPAVVSPPPPSARPEVPAQSTTFASSVPSTQTTSNPATPRLFHAFVQIPESFIEKDAERDRKIHELSEECAGLRKRMDELFSCQEKAERRTGMMKQDLEAQAAQFLHMSSRVNTVETRSVENAALAEPFKQEIQNLTNLHCAQMGALVARLSRTEQALSVADQARQQVHGRLDHAMTVLEQVWSELMNTRIYVHEEVNRPRDVSSAETMTDSGQLQLVTFPTVSHQSTAPPSPPAPPPPQKITPAQQTQQQESAKQQTARKSVDAEMAAEALRLLGERNADSSTTVNEQLELNTASTSSSMDVVSQSEDDRAGENGSPVVDKECERPRELKLPVLMKRDSGEHDEEMAPIPPPAERTPVEKRPAQKSTVAEKKQTQSEKPTQSVEDASASRQLFKKQKKDKKTPASMDSLAVHSVVVPDLSSPVSAAASSSPARHSSSSSAGITGSGTVAVPSRLEQSAACPLPIRRIQKLEPIDDYETHTHGSPMSGQASATSVTVVATAPAAPPSSLPLDQLESLIKRSPPSSPPPEEQSSVPLIEEPDDQPADAALSSGWMPSLTSIAGGQKQTLQVMSTTTVCSTSSGSSSSARPSDPRVAAKPSTIPATELFASQIQQLQQAVAIQQQMQALPVGRYADGSFYTPQPAKKPMGSCVMFAAPTPSGRHTSSSSQDQSSSGMAGGGATGEWSQQQVQWMQHMQHLANQGYYWAQATPAMLQQQQQYSFGSMMLQEPPPPPPPPPAQQPQLAIANEGASPAPAPDGVVSGEEMTSLHPLVRLTITRPQ